jgi:hypothetical protein
MDAMEFFKLSTGKWRSQRTTHHLAFKRAESGDSEIYVEALTCEHPKVAEICQLHEVDQALAIGGAFVSWDGSMGWDRSDENHEGSTVFVLIPDADDVRRGRLLRERGYAEIVPVVGRYHMDDEDGLVLTTEYETMSSIERFWFVSPTLRLRSSTVKRFGGFSTATFCTEARIEDESDAAPSPDIAEASNDQVKNQNPVKSDQYLSVLGW